MPGSGIASRGMRTNFAGAVILVVLAGLGASIFGGAPKVSIHRQPPTAATTACAIGSGPPPTAAPLPADQQRPRTIRVLVTAPAGTKLEINVTGRGPVFAPPIHEQYHAVDGLDQRYTYYPTYSHYGNPEKDQSVLTVTAEAKDGVPTDAEGCRLGEIDCTIYQIGEGVEKTLMVAHDNTHTHKEWDKDHVICKRVILPLPGKHRP
jgi:hypothetical protein